MHPGNDVRLGDAVEKILRVRDRDSLDEQPPRTGALPAA
jgi:hypothetical protein